MKTYIIAEIGINHNGSLMDALELMCVAQHAGCHAVKFQKRNPDVCVPEHQKCIGKDTPWGTMSYLEYKKKIEFDKRQFDAIDTYSKDIGIEWSASPWDIDSLDFLMQYDLPWIKLPSAMITNTELVSHCAATHKKLIISTGMSTEQEIDDVVKQVKRYHDNFVLMHCNSTYPAPVEEIDLSCIKKLQAKYLCPVGYSGHELGTTVTSASIYMGATYIERHITLDKDNWGTDQECSLEPLELRLLVGEIQLLELARGKGIIGVTESEKPVRKKLRG